jgi:hypothetical protein
MTSAWEPQPGGANTGPQAPASPGAVAGPPQRYAWAPGAAYQQPKPAARPAAVQAAVVLTFVGAALAAVFVGALLVSSADKTAAPVTALLLALWLVLAAAAALPATFTWRGSNAARWLLFVLMLLYALGNFVLWIVILRVETGRYAGPVRAYLVSGPYLVLSVVAATVAVLLVVEHRFFASR